MYKLNGYRGSGAILIFAFAINQITAESAFCQVRIGGIAVTLPEKTKTIKPDRTKIDQPRAAQPGNDAQLNMAGGQISRLARLEPTSKPIFLKDTVEIKTRTRETYWKLPNVREYTSWLPRVTFAVFYDDSAKLRYRAEWFNPDGSVWFDEMLRYGFLSGDKTVQLQSDYPDELFDTKAVAMNGTYGVKVTDTKTNEVIFQGKFKVNKLLHFPGETKYKNHFVFYVDNDWTLPTGYAGYDFLGSSTSPIAISLWFKDRLTLGDFEARLYRNGQQMTSTDDGGNILSTAERVGDCQRFHDKCVYQLWQFRWDKLRSRNGEVTDYFLQSNPGIKFTDDNPGEYAVKIFHRGVQVREAKFTIDAKGLIARNAFSDQIYLTDHKVAVPVKVLGTLDKWSSATWKTDMFYGNPLIGFDAP